jgi:hypothetical protein
MEVAAIVIAIAVVVKALLDLLSRVLTMGISAISRRRRREHEWVVSEVPAGISTATC